MTTTTSTSTAIAAPPERVWALLTDVAWWNRADNGVVGIDGVIVEGSRIRLVPEDDPARAFELQVSELCSPTSMLWTGGMPLRLCTGRRTFLIEPSRDGCTFSVVEDLTGPLSRLVIRVLPDLHDSFDRLAAALKRDSEAEVARS